jgi:hypothetical protein
MRILPVAAACGLIGLFSLPCFAQESGDSPWSDLRAKNTPGFGASLSLVEPHVYREGELIRADLRFSGPLARPTRPRRPPPERWESSGFLLDPAGECGAPPAPCRYVMLDGVGFGQHDPAQSAPGTPKVTVTLNHYLPRLAPGRYQVAALFRKLVATDPDSDNYTYKPAEPPETVVSNDVQVEVTAESGEWVNQTLADTVAILKRPNDARTTPEESVQRQVAQDQLRFLDVPAAWRATLAFDDYYMLRGLQTTHDPAQLCALMKAQIPEPSQAVSTWYLGFMVGACARAEIGPPPKTPAQPWPLEVWAQEQQYLRRREAYSQDLTGKAAASLAASIAAKQDDARSLSLPALLTAISQGPRGQSSREWAPVAQEEFKRVYPTLQGEPRHMLLEQYASNLRLPDAVPLLEAVMNEWNPEVPCAANKPARLGPMGQVMIVRNLEDPCDAPRQALRNLNLIDPVRAQARIVAELAKPRTWMDSPQLDLLPASAARISDDALIADLNGARCAGDGNVPLRMTALAKYASPKALDRLKAIFESERDSCQPELMAYFVRVGPAYADQVFHSGSRSQHGSSECAAEYFERTPQIAMGNVLERYMTESLLQKDAPLVKAAAQALALYGSPAAREALLKAFHDLQDFQLSGWKLPLQGNPSRGLDDEIRDALVNARHWSVTEADLHDIERLCTTERCRTATQAELQAQQSPLRIVVDFSRDGMSAQVAQYYGIDSMEALEDKLGQYPKGTRFALIVDGLADSEAEARIRKYADAHGLTIVPLDANDAGRETPRETPAQSIIPPALGAP